MSKGFTLIELLVVISIIGVLSTVVIGELNQARKNAEYTKGLQELQSVKNASELYKSVEGTYPAENSIALTLSELLVELGGNNYLSGSIDSIGDVPAASIVYYNKSYSSYNSYACGEEHTGNSGYLIAVAIFDTTPYTQSQLDNILNLKKADLYSGSTNVTDFIPYFFCTSYNY